MDSKDLRKMERSLKKILRFTEIVRIKNVPVRDRKKAARRAVGDIRDMIWREYEQQQR